MVLEGLLLAGSWHPHHEGEMNPVNPGAIVTVSDYRGIDLDHVTPYWTAGAYLDSYRKLAVMAGGGIDIGEDYGGGLALTHVQGSHLERILIVPMPSIFYRHGQYGARIICAPDASVFALAFTYTFR